MQRLWALIVAVWFLVVTGLVLVPAFLLLIDRATTKLPDPPTAPALAAEEAADFRNSKVTLFGQQVSLYEKQLAAYKEPVTSRYDLVVAGMVLIGTIGLCLDAAMRGVEKLPALRWGYAGAAPERA